MVSPAPTMASVPATTKITCALSGVAKRGKEEANAIAQIAVTTPIVTSGRLKRFRKEKPWRFTLFINPIEKYATPVQTQPMPLNRRRSDMFLAVAYPVQNVG
jgi:hypothetical protein